MGVLMTVLAKLTRSFSIWVFFHEHSRFTGHQGKGETISLTLLYHIYPVYRHLDTVQLLQRAHLYTYVAAAGLKPETFGFLAQVANHHATRSKNLIYYFLKKKYINIDYL